MQCNVLKYRMLQTNNAHYLHPAQRNQAGTAAGYRLRLVEGIDVVIGDYGVGLAIIGMHDGVPVYSNRWGNKHSSSDSNSQQHSIQQHVSSSAAQGWNANIIKLMQHSDTFSNNEEYKFKIPILQQTTNLNTNTNSSSSWRLLCRQCNRQYNNMIQISSIDQLYTANNYNYNNQQQQHLHNSNNNHKQHILLLNICQLFIYMLSQHLLDNNLSPMDNYCKIYMLYCNSCCTHSICMFNNSNTHLSTNTNYNTSNRQMISHMYTTLYGHIINQLYHNFKHINKQLHTQIDTIINNALTSNHQDMHTLHQIRTYITSYLSTIRDNQQPHTQQTKLQSNNITHHQQQIHYSGRYHITHDKIKENITTNIKENKQNKYGNYMPHSISAFQMLSRLNNINHTVDTCSNPNQQKWMSSRPNNVHINCHASAKQVEAKEVKARSKENKENINQNYKYGDYSINLLQKNINKQSQHILKNGRKYASDRHSQQKIKQSKDIFSLDQFTILLKNNTKRDHILLNKNKTVNSNSKRIYTERNQQPKTLNDSFGNMTMNPNQTRNIQRATNSNFQYNAPELTYKRPARHKTQGSNHSLSKKKRSSFEIFASQSIDSKAKKDNNKLLQKSRQNKITKQQKIVEKLRIIRNQYPFGAQQCLNYNSRKSNRGNAWQEIAQISKQILNQHLDTYTDRQSSKFSEQNKPQQIFKFCQTLEINEENAYQTKGSSKNIAQNCKSLKTTNVQEQEQINKTLQKNQQQTNKQQKQTIQIQQIKFDSNSKPNQKLSSKKLIIKQQKPKINQFKICQQIWCAIEHQLLSKINPIGQSINQIKQLFKICGIKTLMQLYLLYKQFFYMRTALLSQLLNFDKSILPGYSNEVWKMSCQNQLHNQRIKIMQDQNQYILETLQKMQKKLLQKTKKQPVQAVNPKIIDIMVEDEQIYEQFTATMIKMNIEKFKNIRQILAKQQKYSQQSGTKEKSMLRKYGINILLAAFDEISQIMPNQLQRINSIVEQSEEQIEISQIVQILQKLGKLMVDQG